MAILSDGTFYLLWRGAAEIDARKASEEVTVEDPGEEEEEDDEEDEDDEEEDTKETGGESTDKGSKQVSVPVFRGVARHSEGIVIIQS